MKFPFLGIASREVFDTLSKADRTAICAAYFADVVKVHETGPNRGYWVEKFLGAVGLGPGYAWCAAFVSWVLSESGVPGGPKRGRAAVINWMHWAHETGRLFPMSKAVRGDLVGYVSPKTGLGHIGICIGPGDSDGYRKTIEGNTNDQGGREGIEVARMHRQVRETWWCIKL